MNIVFLDAYTTNPGDLSWSPLESLGSLILHEYTAPEDIISRAANADIVITNKCKMTSEVLAELPNLQMIAVAATGYNNIDLVAARNNNTVVVNVAGYSTDSVVQHTFALLLTHLHRVQDYSFEVKQGHWAHSKHFAYTQAPIRSLTDMTLGVYGFGTIGQAVARLAVTFGMRVIAHRQRDVPSPVDGVVMVDSDTLWRESDVLTLHAPGSPSTDGIINKSTLKLCKQNLVLINTARGTLINDIDLAAWLTMNPQATALIDVLIQEPPPSDHPLYAVENVFLTPHQAWMGVAARRKLIQGIADNIEAFQSGTLESL